MRNGKRRGGTYIGHKGLVDLVLLVGLYVTTCTMINAFEVPSPVSSPDAKRTQDGHDVKSAGPVIMEV
jgi:hypothetical protein